MVLSKNAETRTALVYKRLVLRKNSWEVTEVASIAGGGRNDMLDMDFPFVLKVLGQNTFI